MGWFAENIWNPMVLRQGYNTYTTLIVAVAYAILVFAFWEIAKRWKQKEFRSAFIPWLVFAGLLRFADGPLITPTPLTSTPGIWVLIPILFLSVAVFDLKLAKDLGYLLTLILGLAVIQILKFNKLNFAVLAILPLIISYFLIRRIPWMGDPLPWMSHVFEAWISGFGVMAGLFEEHVLARAVMDIHPLMFGIFKTLVLIFVFYLIRNEKNEEGIFLRTAILSLGMAAGIRNLMELLSL